jgi:hypothetical protein
MIETALIRQATAPAPLAKPKWLSRIFWAGLGAIATLIGVVVIWLFL